MKILYVMRSVGFFSYHETVIKHLCNNGNRVEVLFDQQSSEGKFDHAVQACLAKTPELTRDWLIRRNDWWRQPLFDSRAILSYASYLTRKEQSTFYLKRWEKYLPSRIRTLTTRSKYVRAFLASSMAQFVLRTFERLVPPDSTIARSLEDKRPDIVVISPRIRGHSEVIEYIKAAKILNIPTVVLVLSWDNLTTKGLLYIIPDLTLAWNQTHFNDATGIHNVPSDKIVITGAPFFDKWFGAEQLSMEREAFCKRVGIDQEKPFLLYLGSSAAIAGDETWLVRELAEAIRENPNSGIRRMNILVRPHSANAQFYEQFKEEQVSIWPKQGALPDTKETVQDFYNSLRYCVATVGVNTSGMIDAIIADKPCVTILTERYRDTQSQAVHFHDLLNADVLEIAKSAKECADIFEILLNGVDSKKEARHRFVREFIRPRGLHRPAGDVAAKAIELAALRKSAAEIDSAIADTELSNEVT